MITAIGAVIGIVAVVIIPAVRAFFMIEGLDTGVVRVSGGSYSRATDPIWFWIVISTYAGTIAVFGYFIAEAGKLLFY